jgi:6-phosphofructokinase 1
MLDRDIDHLREVFAVDQGQSRAGKIILRNEKASKTYTTQMLADVINEEAKGRFEARIGVPGHFQQGKEPSPMDRIRAVRFGVRSLQHIESFAGKSREEILKDPLSCSVIGIRGAKVGFSAMETVENEQTDWKHRRPKDESWAALKGLGDTLSGRFSGLTPPQPIEVMPV